MKKEGTGYFLFFFEIDKCVRVKEVDKKEEDDDEEAKKEVDDEKEKSVSTTVSCLCMKDNDFSSRMSYTPHFLPPPRLAPCMLGCVLATMRCRTRSTNERHIIYIYIWRERFRWKERMTAPFVVHHVERISFLSSFFSRFLILLLMWMRFLSLRHIIKQ